MAWCTQDGLRDYLAWVDHAPDAGRTPDHRRGILVNALEDAQTFIEGVVWDQCQDVTLAEAARQTLSYHRRLAKLYALNDERQNFEARPDESAITRLEDQIRGTVFTDAAGVPLAPPAGAAVARAGVLGVRSEALSVPKADPWRRWPAGDVWRGWW